jgi:hypothetical protein
VKVKPMIGEYEVPGILRIGTVEDRRLVEIPVPGLEGGYTQDLGSASVTIRIEGTLAGDDARDDFLTTVRELFKAGDPIDFVADIATATAIDQVLVSDLRVGEAAGSTDSFRYSVELTQYVVPPSTSPGSDMGFGDLSDLNDAMAGEAGGLFDAMQVPDMLGAIPDLKDPTPPLSGVTDGVKNALSGLNGASGALSELFGGS